MDTKEDQQGLRLARSNSFNCARPSLSRNMQSKILLNLVLAYTIDFPSHQLKVCIYALSNTTIYNHFYMLQRLRVFNRCTLRPICLYVTWSIVIWSSATVAHKRKKQVLLHRQCAAETRKQRGVNSLVKWGYIWFDSWMCWALIYWHITLFKYYYYCLLICRITIHKKVEAKRKTV